MSEQMQDETLKESVPAPAEEAGESTAKEAEEGGKVTENAGFGPTETAPAAPAEAAEEVPAFDAGAEAAALYRAFPYLPEEGRATIAGAPRYAALRAVGLSAREAALSVFGEMPAMGVAGHGKSHLTGMAGKIGVEPLPTMSEQQYATARAAFGETVSDAELEALFRRVR